MARASSIHIKPSKRGTLRKALGVKKGKKIPAAKLKTKTSDSAAMARKKNFARNARKWKKELYIYPSHTAEGKIHNIIKR